MRPSSTPTKTTVAALLTAVLAGLLLLCSAPPGARAQSSRRAAHAAIIGGSLARSGQLPWLADIVELRGHVGIQCTGTVVSPTLVLTAGHCAVDPRTGRANSAGGYRVLTNSLNGSGPERQVSGVSGVIVYERFHHLLADNDAALLVLATPTSAPPVPLATPSFMRDIHAGTIATIAGWGKTAYAQQLPTEALRLASTVVQGPRWCVRNAPPFFRRSEICTVDSAGFTTGVCNGDSGGPLLAAPAGGEQPVQIGITSHVYGRCSTRLPSVFTSVAPIASWVQTWIRAYTPAAPAPATPMPPAAPATPAPSATSAAPAPPGPPATRG